MTGRDDAAPVSRTGVERRLASSDPEVRRRAVADVPRLGRSGAELVVAALGDEDWRVRKEASSAATQIGPQPDFVASLVRALGTGHNVGQHNAAVEALGSFRDAAIAELAAAIDNFDADARKLVAEALARTAEESALDVLQRLAADEDANVRVAAIEAIAAAGTASVDRAVPLLERAFASEHQMERLAALDGLNRLGVSLRWAQIESAISDPILRRSAVDAAGRNHSREAGDALARCLHEAKPRTLPTVMNSAAKYARAGRQQMEVLRSALANLQADPQVCLQFVGEDHTPELRRAAVALTPAFGGRSSVAAAVSALDDDAVGEEAENALIALGESAVDELVAAVAASAGSRRAFCLELLGRVSGTARRQDALTQIRAGLSDADPIVMCGALSGLAMQPDGSALSLVVRCLIPDAPLSVRHAAMAALSACAATDPDAARDWVERARDDETRALAVTALLFVLDSPTFESEADDVEYLRDALSNPAPSVRSLALEALALRPGPDSATAISFALTDEESEVRLAAVRGLGRLRGEQWRTLGAPQVLALTESAREPVILAAAARALGQSGDATVIPRLKELARDPRAPIASAAVDAVSQLSDPSLSDVLIEAASHQESEVVKTALRALAHSGGTREMVHLAACLDHEAWDVRRLAADLLARYGGKSSVPTLRARLSIESDPIALEALSNALATLESRLGLRRSLPPPGGAGE